MMSNDPNLITIEKIEREWARDSIIDRTRLGDDSANQYVLHSKYHRILNIVRRKLRELQGQKSRLVLLKTDYYSNQIAPQQLKELGWTPNKRVIIKSEIGNFLDGDEDIIQINLQIGDLVDMVDFLNNIIKSINQRQFTIKNIIEHNKFENAVN